MATNTLPSRFDDWTIESIETIVMNGPICDLQQVPIVITCWGTPDPKWSERVCRELANHSDPTVRGNAILGFGHLARVTGLKLRVDSIQAIRAALTDPESYVRDQAHSAADDIRQFLGVDLP